MEKPALSETPVHELISRRWSPVCFAERPVAPEVLRSLLEAARWAPSAFNEQPWRFLVATRDEEARYERLLGCLMEANKGWASRAPVLVLAVAKLRFSHNGNENRHALYDTGAAIENLVLQATAHGVFAHQMGGFDGTRARELFVIPEGFTPVVMVALGYPGDPDELPEPLRQRQLAERQRKPLGKMVFTDRWEEPSSLVLGEG